MSDVQELILKLENQSKSNEDKCLDLKQLTFVSEKGEMRLEADGGPHYYFKRDPKNPKAAKIAHAIKQYCKLIGIPFSFFHKNSEDMKNRMATTWLNSLKSEKATVLAKLRRVGNDYIIRALLPVEFSNISNLDVMRLVSETVGDGFKIEFSIGDEQDDLILHIRFVSKDVFEISGEKCSYGFSVIASELGAAPLSVDTFLYRNESESALIASYGNESFFSCDYDQIQPNDLKSLFPALIERLKSQLPQIKELIQSAKEFDSDTKEDVYALLRDLRLKKGLSDRFHSLLSQEICDDNDVRNKWDVSGKMAIVAKEFEVTKRLKVEKAAGEMVRLCFEKA